MLHNIIKRGVFNFLKGHNIEHILAETPEPKVAPKNDFEVHYPVHLETTIKLIREQFSKQDPSKASEPKAMLDCTLGTGGHAKLLLEAFPNLHILGIDIDNRMVDYVNKNLKEGLEPAKQNRLHAKNRNFSKMDKLLPYQSFPETFNKKAKFDCILADLGYNSLQLGGDEWGLAYNTDQPLDMRYNRETMRTTAADLVNEASAHELKEMFEKFGEEPAAGHITKVIIEERKNKKIETTKQLKDVLFDNLNPRADKYRILMRVFQALRIAINNELMNLEELMDKIMIPLEKDGVGIIITFHSLEQQLVVQRIRELKRQAKIKIIENGILPSEEEINMNSRSKSARLYCFQKLVV